jgi:pyrimidine-nucleoside phosphorylase
MTDQLVVPRLIERKRDGGTLSEAEWRGLIAGYVGGKVPDYQIAALAMAIVFRGLDDAELVALTGAMLESGEQLDLRDLDRPKVDKHSIGGVGDKTSLLLAPMLAALDVVVPMIAGRGLGHTGGTVDKLEAIPGYRTELSLAEVKSQLERIGVVMVGQTPDLVPADRKLYGLRDVTGTVESIPLLASSIMSKKLAESLDGLVLDIKIGSGAFLTDPAQSMVLAQTMIRLGEARGCRTRALLTAMDRPLGIACGNGLEVREAIAGLRGEGPADLMAVTFALGSEMVLLAGRAGDRDAARGAVEAVIERGAALEKFRQLVAAQGGDPAVVDHPDRLPRAPIIEPLLATRSGLVARIEPRLIGHAIIALGGGRMVASDPIDPAVGIEVLVEPGNSVTPGTPLARVHARSESALEAAFRTVSDAIPIADRADSVLPLLSHRVTIGGVEPMV